VCRPQASPIPFLEERLGAGPLRAKHSLKQEAPRRVWIAWETQRRNRTLSQMVRARLFEFDTELHRLLRYPLFLAKTMGVLSASRPSLLLVQNPSLLLALFAVFYGRAFRIPVVVDAHNAGLFPLEGRSRLLNWIAGRIRRMAMTTIVSNVRLAESVVRDGGTAFVMPDPIPQLPPPQSARLRGKSNVLFVCTWAADEPYLQVVEAAELAGSSVCIYMTGRRRNAEKRLSGACPDNVVLTDYLSEADYVQMLYSCDVVVVLTKRDNCLTCGAYEAIAAERPLIVSDTPVLRELFSRGALYTDNTAQDIARKIHEAIRRKDELTRDIRLLKQELSARSSSTIEAFEHHLREHRIV